MKKLITFLVFLMFNLVQSQQLNCIVTINKGQLTNPNQQVYKTLQNAITEFVNKTDWNGVVLKQNERINCSMYINLTSHTADQFIGTIQIQSSRSIFNSTYSSPIFNYNDKEFAINYTEFEPLLFNPETYESSLVSLLSFYSYIILGMDADSFQNKGGENSFKTAQNIANLAQQGGAKGWGQTDGIQNRYYLINDLLSPNYDSFRSAQFAFHKALDTMSVDVKTSKNDIKTALLSLNVLNKVKPNSFLNRIFFDAKADEIVSIFSGGPVIAIADLVDTLNKISPLNSMKWSAIKY